MNGRPDWSLNHSSTWLQGLSRISNAIVFSYGFGGVSVFLAGVGGSGSTARALIDQHPRDRKSPRRKKRLARLSLVARIDNPPPCAEDGDLPHRLGLRHLPSALSPCHPQERRRDRK